MPQFLSLEVQSLLRALFKRNPANRLGNLHRNRSYMELRKMQETVRLHMIAATQNNNAIQPHPCVEKQTANQARS